MPSIRLHPEKGVNPHLGVCDWCGADIGVVLLGAHDGMWKCQHGHVSIGGAPRGRSPCGCLSYDWRKECTVGEFEKLPMGRCDACQAKKQACEEEVRQGGIHWRCSDCKSAGAIKAGHPLTLQVRAQLKVDPPNPCGAEFSKKDCPVCGPHPVGDAV